METVKYTEFIEHPDISIAALFNDLFTDGEWLHIESKDEYDVVEYNGKKEIEDVTHEVSIIFNSYPDEETVMVDYIVLDGDKLDAYGTDDFLLYLFDEHETFY